MASSHTKGFDLWHMENRVAIKLLVPDSPGILIKALNVFSDNNIDLTSIKSRPPKINYAKKCVEFDIDFHG